MITQSNWLSSTEGKTFGVEYDGSCDKKKKEEEDENLEEKCFHFAEENLDKSKGN